MGSWKTDPLPIHDPPWSHPDWAYAGPTPDADVLFFRVVPTMAWQALAVEHEGPIRLRHRREGDVVRLEAHVPAEAASEPDAPAFYTSLWIGEGDPIRSQTFRLEDGCDVAAEAAAPDDPVIVGVYVGPDVRGAT